MCMRERIHIPMCMREIRNTNLNVRKYKYQGPRFGGGEGIQEDRHASVNTNITFAQDCKLFMKKTSPNKITTPEKASLYRKYIDHP